MEITMIDCGEKRPDPFGNSGGYIFMFGEGIDFEKVKKFTTHGELYELLGKADCQNLMRNISLPPGLMLPNLFLFIVKFSIKNDQVYVDVDIDVRLDCQQESEPVTYSIEGVALADHERVNQIHFKAINHYRAALNNQ